MFFETSNKLIVANRDSQIIISKITNITRYSRQSLDKLCRPECKVITLDKFVNRADMLTHWLVLVNDIPHAVGHCQTPPYCVVVNLFSHSNFFGRDLTGEVRFRFSDWLEGITEF